MARMREFSKLRGGYYDKHSEKGLVCISRSCTIVGDYRPPSEIVKTLQAAGENLVAYRTGAYDEHEDLDRDKMGILREPESVEFGEKSSPIPVYDDKVGWFARFRRCLEQKREDSIKVKHYREYLKRVRAQENKNAQFSSTADNGKSENQQSDGVKTDKSQVETGENKK